MKVACNLIELSECLRGIDASTLGFVPTMGALHRGHISLVERAKEECKAVAVSIFVNPTQFNDPKDLKSYPRMEESDLAMLESAGVDVVFMPAVEDIYPQPDRRKFDFGQLERVMEGASRPGHFNGVAQVVSRLFELIPAKKAYFGEKDFQQVAVVRAMVEQLGLGVEIVACPTMREADGLALSSRNMLLDEAHREVAPMIYEIMKESADTLKWYVDEGDMDVLEDGMSPREVERRVKRSIESASNGLLDVIYFNIVNSKTLAQAQKWDEQSGVRGCIAVQAGNVRLIDNIQML